MADRQPELCCVQRKSLCASCRYLPDNTCVWTGEGTGNANWCRGCCKAGLDLKGGRFHCGFYEREPGSDDEDPAGESRRWGDQA